MKHFCVKQGQKFLCKARENSKFVKRENQMRSCKARTDDIRKICADQKMVQCGDKWLRTCTNLYARSQAEKQKPPVVLVWKCDNCGFANHQSITSCNYCGKSRQNGGGE